MNKSLGAQQCRQEYEGLTFEVRGREECRVNAPSLPPPFSLAPLVAAAEVARGRGRVGWRRVGEEAALDATHGAAPPWLLLAQYGELGAQPPLLHRQSPAGISHLSTKRLGSTDTQSTCYPSPVTKSWLEVTSLRYT